MIRSYSSDDSAYKRDNGLAAWGLLIIPLFLLVLGFGAFNLFTANSQKGSNQTANTTPAQTLFGVGGAPPTGTPNPTRKPTVTLTPTKSRTPTPTGTLKDSTTGPTTEYGIGGSPGNDTTSLPDGAPRTGGGGSYKR
ncbi:MAG: hypothetical protein RI947_1209 [Candidatus Parcubacteria bacterium]|jgi:hypothetical protein